MAEERERDLEQMNVHRIETYMRMRPMNRATPLLSDEGTIYATCLGVSEDTMAAPSMTMESPLKKSGSGTKAAAFTVQANMKNVQVLAQ